MRWRAVWLAFVVGAAANPAPALGQDADVDTATARRLFGEGLEALEDERWQDARDAFRRSHELVPRPNTLLNLATAQAELNLPVRAIESYRAFIAQATRRQRRHVREAERAIAELQERVAYVELTIPDLASGDQIRLDDEELGREALLEPIALDPGQHTVLVMRGEHTAGEVQLTLVEGETRGLELALHPPPVVVETPALIESVDEDSDDTALFVGVGVGGAVVAIGIAVALGVALGQGEEEPFVGNLGPGTVTF